MKFTRNSVAQGKNILANDHFVAIPFDCSALTALATNGVITAGTIIPANDSTAVGVLLNDVVLSENPNGTIVIHGFVRKEQLTTTPSSAAMTALKDISFIDAEGKPILTKFAVNYDKNGGTGSVTDSSSPYVYGTTVTVKASTGLTAPTGKAFSGWALAASATTKNDDFDPSDTFAIKDNITLYAVWIDE